MIRRSQSGEVASPPEQTAAPPGSLAGEVASPPSSPPAEEAPAPSGAEAPQAEFTGPERRRRSDRRSGGDRRVGLPDRRLIRRERRSGAGDRRAGRDRREVGIVLTDPRPGEDAVPLAPVASAPRRVPRQRRRPAPDPGVLRRRRLALLAGLLVLVLAIAGVASALLLGGGDAPPDGAAAVVPADALAYVHFSTDPHRPATRQALARARRLPDYPLISTYVLQRLEAIIGGGQVVDFATRIRPWLGREASLALLNTATSTADSLIVLDVTNAARARRFLTAQHAVPAGRYRGIRLLSYPATGAALAFLSHYLVLGQAASVQRAIDVVRGAAPLTQDPSFQAAVQGEPDDRVVDLYTSAPGERRLLVAASGLTGLLGTLLDDPALSGVGMAVSPAPGGARIWIHRALDPTLLKLSGSRQRPFAPTLQDALPATTLAAVQVRGLGGFVPKLLGTAGGSGVGGPLGSLLRRLTGTLSAEGINLHQIGAVFAGESAFALLDHAGRTSLLLVTRTDHPAEAGQELAGLEAPLAQLFPPPGSGPGQAAVFSNVTVDGVAAHQLQLNPGLEFDYAIWNNMVIVSTSLDGIAQVVRHNRALSGTAAFTGALPDPPSQVTSLLFLDFSQLLGIGEQTGLLRGKLLSTLRPDLQRIRTVGLSSTGGEADTTAELLLQIP